ncbi:MAG: DUF1801 domain-containing protein [Pseudomonadota bacterium]
MNSDWHKRHRLPKGSTLAQRIAWHLEHQKRCACRPVPATLAKQMADPSKKRDPAVDEYLAKVSPTSRALLRELRKTIHAVVPKAEECISYRLPAFRLSERIIAGFSATSRGCSYYPFSGTTLETLAGELEGYSHTKSALHFGPEKPLPAALVRKLLKARIAERTRRPARRR